MTDDAPFACDLSALSPEDRATHHELGARMLASIQRTDDLPDGYAFELAADRISLTDLARWAELERRCCPFFDFHIVLGRHNGPLALCLTGRAGIKPFIQAEFPRIFRN